RGLQAEVLVELVAAEHLVAGVLVVGERLVHHRLADAGAGIEADRLRGLGAEGEPADGEGEDGSGNERGLAHGGGAPWIAREGFAPIRWRRQWRIKWRHMPLGVPQVER